MAGAGVRRRGGGHLGVARGCRAGKGGSGENCVHGGGRGVAISSKQNQQRRRRQRGSSGYHARDGGCSRHGGPPTLPLLLLGLAAELRLDPIERLQRQEKGAGGEAAATHCKCTRGKHPAPPHGAHLHQPHGSHARHAAPDDRALHRRGPRRHPLDHRGLQQWGRGWGRRRAAGGARAGGVRGRVTVNPALPRPPAPSAHPTRVTSLMLGAQPARKPRGAWEAWPHPARAPRSRAPGPPAPPPHTKCRECDAPRP